MSAPRPSSTPETVTIPRAELATQAALLALADRALGLARCAGPHGNLALMDLEREFFAVRAAIRNEIESRADREWSASIARGRKGGRPLRTDCPNIFTQHRGSER